jgi:hypothetical protein
MEDHERTTNIIIRFSFKLQIFVKKEKKPRKEKEKQL